MYENYLQRNIFKCSQDGWISIDGNENDLGVKALVMNIIYPIIIFLFLLLVGIFGLRLIRNLRKKS
ncbi:hypothetical protein CVD25_07620 [Bacillus canaveralius]|uniref:Uncharacterized protein n=1 Tax=Bacillus canaveralius TaxID=1403243 RepID=A0A2N5GS14_9BACI|nr:hypothetical protein CVD23_21415 [Bacillus sp. V33-4]PLR86350.1 hypothetical protein CU635_01775 [Bacillus canaveralius]PLR98583.1 hypothetical protein CVD25_07620 [Bacillus canaveralius]